MFLLERATVQNCENLPDYLLIQEGRRRSTVLLEPHDSGEETSGPRMLSVFRGRGVNAIWHFIPTHGQIYMALRKEGQPAITGLMAPARSIPHTCRGRCSSDHDELTWRW